MMNGELVRKAVSGEKGSYLNTVLSNKRGCGTTTPACSRFTSRLWDGFRVDPKWVR